VNKVRRYLQHSAGVYLAFVFLSGALPPISMQFTGILPYLNVWQFYERLIFVFLNWCFAIIFYLIVSTEKQKKSVLLTIQFNLKDWILGVLGILLFICSGAWLAANSLGPLVKILPNELYTSRMVIVNVEADGSRNKSANLDLKSIADGKIYYLTLSKRLFNYPKFNIGDKLILKGRQNWFGVYVEEFQRVK
jgi:hypothetical protein